MKQRFVLFIVILSFFSCTKPVEKEEPVLQLKTEVDTIAHFIKPGKLVALIENNITSYYINKGRPRGFEYEMLKAFCDDNGLELEVRMTNGINEILDSVSQNKVDIGAGNLSVTGERKKTILFSPTLLKTRQVIVQSMPKGYKKMSRSKIKSRVITDALELEGKTVHVLQHSSFKTRLENLSQENGLDLNIITADIDMSIDDLMELVSRGEIQFTILDENMAFTYKNIYPNLFIETPVSLSQNIAWAINPKNKGLYNMMETWFSENRNSAKWNTIYNRYYKFKSREISFLKNNLHNVHEKELSPYDFTVKQYSSYIQWDWRLVTAIIKKESNFNPEAQSKFGATGLMQLLPTTAERFGVTEQHLKSPDQNIKAGTRFLQWLESYWTKHLGDSTDLTPYILASYNCGPGHVQDAIKLARKNGYNHLVWNDNVELMLYNKSKRKYYNDPVVKHGYCRGREPVNYVRDIIKHYNYYKIYTGEKTLNNSTAAL